MNPRLETEYLGLKLRNPLIVGASPLGDSAEVAQELQERGAGAIVMRSLFEEQIEIERRAGEAFIESHGESFAEATSYFPSVAEYVLGPEDYLRQLERLKKGWRSLLSPPSTGSPWGDGPTMPSAWRNAARMHWS